MRTSLRYRLCELRYIYYTLRFNFHYLGWKGLLKRPVVFYSPVKLRDMKGQIVLNAPMRHALVSIGLPGNEMFHYDTPCIWSDQGGTIIFDDSFGTNPGASFVIRKGATLHISGHGSFGQNLRILCSKEINIGKDLLGSWDITIMDTDSHYFENMETHQMSEFSRPVTIGNHCFLGSTCSILKGARLADGVVIASHAVVTGSLGQKNALYAGIPAKFVKSDIMYHH